MDPDERLSKEDLEKIKALTEQKDVAAYSFNSRNYHRNTAVSGFVPCRGQYKEFEKDYPGYFESRKIRFFQNIPGVRFVGSVHELVESTIKGKVVESDIPFHHYGSTPEVDAQKGKKTFYQAQGIKKAHENPKDWKSHFELGIEFLGAKEHAKAAVELEKAKNLKPGDTIILSNLGYSYMESAKLDKAEAILKECMKVDENHHDAFLNMGVTKMRRDDWDGALDWFNKVIRKHPNSFLTYRNAGLCHAHKKNFQAAAKCFEIALRIFPNYVDARIDLGLVCFAGGRPDLAKPILEEALKQNPNSIRAQAVLEDVNKMLTKAKKSKS
jgi:tetratricopeptide (TPR) repeat protein